ncbi:MAG: hypothetical protein ACC652_05890 [Acidimicrobiales bacterium]
MSCTAHRGGKGVIYDELAGALRELEGRLAMANAGLRAIAAALNGDRLPPKCFDPEPEVLAARVRHLAGCGPTVAEMAGILGMAGRPHGELVQRVRELLGMEARFGLK